MKVSNQTASPTQGQAGANSAGPAGNGDFFDTFKKLPDGRFRSADSGLKIAVVKEGTGEVLTNGMHVKINYSGWLENGTKFDSSIGKGRPFEFTLGAGRVIKGWEEGLLGMTVGERRQLIIPAKLAYGDRAVGEIPPGATLVFNVEAVGVANPRGEAGGGTSVYA